MKRFFFSLLAGVLAIAFSVFPSQTASATGGNGSGNCGWSTYTEPCSEDDTGGERIKCETMWFGSSNCTFVNCDGTEIDAGTDLSDESCG